MPKKPAVIAALIVALFLFASSCSVEQLKDWYTSHGVDYSQMSDRDLEDGAIVATAYWDAVLTAPPATAAPAPTRPYLGAFLECVRHRESRGDYAAYNGSSGASGAFQFLQATWDNTARHAERYDLVGIQARWASPMDQDLMALHLLNWYGPSPWAGPGCG